MIFVVSRNTTTDKRPLTPPGDQPGVQIEQPRDTLYTPRTLSSGALFGVNGKLVRFRKSSAAPATVIDVNAF